MKSFLRIGLASLLLVVILLITRPTEQTFNKVMKQKTGITCIEQNFTCSDGKHSLDVVNTKVQNGVFYIRIEKTLKEADGRFKTVTGFGILGMFLRVQID